jgi:hypothetical protein
MAQGHISLSRVPYSFQWGPPTFHFKTGIIMIIVSLVASVDLVCSFSQQNRHSSASVKNALDALKGKCALGPFLKCFGD